MMSSKSCWSLTSVVLCLIALYVFAIACVSSVGCGGMSPGFVIPSSAHATPTPINIVATAAIAVFFMLMETDDTRDHFIGDRQASPLVPDYFVVTMAYVNFPAVRGIEPAPFAVFGTLSEVIACGSM